MQDGFKLTQPEFLEIRLFLEKHCGIHLEDDKDYLVETRLTDLVIRNNCDSFHQFHVKASQDATGELKNQIIDAMTTNETSWFRDKNLWDYMENVTIPNILDIAEYQGKARIWSTAASTGQEAYSVLMLLNEAAISRGKPDLINHVEVIGTDISSSAVMLANAARYNSIAMGRGVPPDKKEKYFTKNGDIWTFHPELRKHVTFKRFNLQESFNTLGIFDLILCRYVIIYFSDSFKRELFTKLAAALKDNGILILGGSESLREFSTAFDISYHNNTIINVKKRV